VYEGPRGAERTIVHLTTELTSGGRRALRVEADSGFFQTQSSEVKLVGIHASILSTDGVAAVTIEADSALLEEDAQRLTALGNVLVRSRGGTSVETAKLLFDAATSRLTSDSTVVREGGRTESGPCFESDSQLSQWRFCDGPA
jgi:LPS export ABC transporter protein LptC